MLSEFNWHSSITKNAVFIYQLSFDIFWGYMRDIVYMKKVKPLEQLHWRIAAAVTAVNMLTHVAEDMTWRGMVGNESVFMCVLPTWCHKSKQGFSRTSHIWKYGEKCIVKNHSFPKVAWLLEARLNMADLEKQSYLCFTSFLCC